MIKNYNIEILKEFFNKGKVKIGVIEDFWESDLYHYMKYQYGSIEFTTKGNSCFMSVQRDKDNNFWIVEKVFYEEKVGEEIGCFIPTSLIHLVDFVFNWSTKKGKQLSEEGYLKIPLSCGEQSITSQMSYMEYSGKNEDTTAHYRYTDKYSEFDASRLNRDELIEFGSFRNIFCAITRGIGSLAALDFFNANFLRYPEGTKIAPHTDVDMTSFANIVFYNGMNNKKKTEIGTWDWYDKIMNAINNNTIDDVDMPHNELSRKSIHEHKCNDKEALLFNFFNPKFYHQVPATLGACHTGLFFGSFKNIINKKDIEW